MNFTLPILSARSLQIKPPVYSIDRPGGALPGRFSPVYFPIGNEAHRVHGYLCFDRCCGGSWFMPLRTPSPPGLDCPEFGFQCFIRHDILGLTLLAMGLACKEIHIGGRNKKLITLESFLIILSGTKLFYILVIHGGFFGGNHGSDQDTYVATAEPRKGSTPVSV